MHDWVFACIGTDSAIQQARMCANFGKINRGRALALYKLNIYEALTTYGSNRHLAVTISSAKEEETKKTQKKAVLTMSLGNLR